MSIPKEPAATPSAGEPEFPFVTVVEYVNALLAEGKPEIYRLVIHEVDRHVLHVVMRHCHGNQLQAAERLGISRMTLRSKLRSLGMMPTRSGNRPKP